MPAGWVDTDDVAEDAPDDADVASGAALADCLGLDPAYFDGDETDGEPTADSEFESPDNLSANSDVQVNPTASEGEEVLAALTGSDAATCLQDAFDAAWDASDVEGVGEATVEELPFEAVGDISAAFQITIPFETDEGTVLYLTDKVIATKGRAILAMEFDTRSESWDSGEALRLTELILDRIPADL